MGAPGTIKRLCKRNRHLSSTMLLLVFLQLLLLQVFLPFVVTQDGPVVSTKYGLVEGMALQSGEGNPLDEFRGIPFGAPPVGDLRWKKPEEPSSWSGILEAKEFGRTCSQLVMPSAREDCLYLNVYVPDSVDEHVNDPLPVMVWVYGGAFLLGSGRTYNGQELATRGRVVVVTFNYRVGATGFLSTESEAAVGNYGLWDQVAALRWVQENIESFGGDSNMVTIFGQSAGGFSVSHLSLSPEARGLFQRVIAMSGSAASYAARSTRLRETALSLAENYDCPVDDDEAMVECLRGIAPASLNLNAILIPLLNNYLPNMVPTQDNEIMTMLPLDAMEQGLNADYDLLAGRTKDDGSMFSMPFSGSSELLRRGILFLFDVWENKEELLDMVLEQYPDIESDETELREKAASSALTDMFFGCGAYEEVGFHSQNADSTGKSTYFYEFDHSLFTKDSWISGTHAEDLAMVWGSTTFSFDENDELVKRNIQAYYTNFAYTGNPNEGPHTVPTEWPQYHVTNQLQMREAVEMTAETLGQDIIDRYNWWNNVFYATARPAMTDQNSKSGNRRDIAEVQRRIQILREKMANLNYDDPMAIQAQFRAIMEAVA